MRRFFLFSAVIASLTGTGAAAAENPVHLTTGAGYAPMVQNIAKVCRAQTNDEIVESYGGNIGQMLAQIRSGSGVNVVISDKTTLANMKTPVRFSVTQSLGSTPLVLVWRKGLDINSPEELAETKVKSVAIPDPRAAVYGRAGAEWIASLPEAQADAVKAKLMQVSGVPQVVGYVAGAEVDVGFVNLQAARKNKDKFAGMKVVEDGYAPIELVAVVVQGEEDSTRVRRFLECLKTQQVKTVLKRAGVE